MDDFLATIQAVQGSSARIDDYLAGYLRSWLYVTENPDGNCRGLSLILYAFWLQAKWYCACIAGELRKCSLPAPREHYLLGAGRKARCYELQHLVTVLPDAKIYNAYEGDCLHWQ